MRTYRNPPIGHIVKAMEDKRRLPGILDTLLAAPSHDAACDIWQSFLAQSPNHSAKTHNRAMKILTAHREGLIS